jgi:hypothetical protein
MSYSAVMGMHAAIEFQYEHPDLAASWHNKSNYLCFLWVDDEIALKNLINDAINTGIRLSIYREPDVDNEIVGVALEAGNKSKKLCSKLDLALKGK